MATDALKSAKDAVQAAHPYYPHDTVLEGYLANEFSIPQLLFYACLCCGTIFSLTYIWAMIQNRWLPGFDILTAQWFALSGCLHIFFEGYFVLHHRDLASHQSLFGQLWKEYAQSDSRYLIQDPFVICVETVTASILGPLCLVTVAMIIRSHPLQYPLQIIVSACHIYSDILYFVTATFAENRHGLIYSRPEPLYFWGYYFFMNIVWIIVPTYLIYRATRIIINALNISDRLIKAKTL